jgi:predicted Zn finger-like uncharacterized protein
MDAHTPSSRQRDLRAVACPQCSTSIRFPLDELAYDGPEVQDVMCASCGTVTGRERLLRQAR